MAVTGLHERVLTEAGRGAVAVVSVADLVKRFGEVEAVSGVSSTVASGEAFAFLGPNGAGKSTTISIVCTLLRPTSGVATVAGCDVLKDPLGVRRHTGLVFQDPTLDDYLTAEENLRFHAQLYRVPVSQISGRLDEVLEMVELQDRRRSLVRTFSGGMKRRLEIARGLMHSPQVLFLDEPTVGLDPQTRAHIWGYINQLRTREHITMFLTTHYMDEAENCEGGEELAPRLITELRTATRSIRIARPTLDGVLRSYTGRTIRAAEASASERMRSRPQARARMRR